MVGHFCFSRLTQETNCLGHLQPILDSLVSVKLPDEFLIAVIFYAAHLV